MLLETLSENNIKNMFKFFFEIFCLKIFETTSLKFERKALVGLNFIGMLL
jgi:hypothetical protein